MVSLYVMRLTVGALLVIGMVAMSASSNAASPLVGSMKKIDGTDQNLSDYSGKVVLIVNVASQCGYTRQYAGLQKLYDTFKDKGFVILGFPANDFGAQEPGSDSEIASFCSKNYGVTFDMFSKITVKGSGKADLYKTLTESADPSGDVGWNFEKFLIDRNGAVVGRFKSGVAPEDPALIQAIEAGADKLCLPLSVSETHSHANLKKSHNEVLEEIRKISEYIAELDDPKRPEFEGNLSTAFGCTLEGSVSEDKVVKLGAQMMQLGCDEVGLSDTTGYANPNQIKRLIRLLKKEVGEENLTSMHLHNTRGLGLANALASFEEGITTLDSSLGGIGGCPFAPGASGNIVTEDLVLSLIHI